MTEASAGNDGAPAGSAQRESAPARPTSARELKAVIEAERRGMPFLLHRDGDDEMRLSPLDGGGALTIGRSPDADISLAWDASVSTVHAEVAPMGSHWLIVDEGLSRNGTFINGERLSGRHRLRHGDVVRAGRTSIAFHDAEAAPDSGTIALATDGGVPAITEAQRRVLSALCRPYRDNSRFATPATNQQIADELFLSVEAVKTHLRELYRRFALESLPQSQKRARLAERALHFGLAGPRDA